MMMMMCIAQNTRLGFTEWLVCAVMVSLHL